MNVHSPAGGQGMNAGIQDAVSLARALADVLDGADEALLDTWAADRHKIAEGVVALTDRMTRMATLRSPAGRALRNVAIGFAGHIPSIGRALARNVAELRIST
jgi:2-polyprenyl-6-methoxyphenol hydroxylase-like FAD-dependent oxidoreductase